MRRFFAGVFAVLLLAGNVQAEEMRVIITIKGRNLFAALGDNPASRMLCQLMPITLKMSCTLPGRLTVNKHVELNFPKPKL